MKHLSRLHKVIIVIGLCLLAQLAISWKVWLPTHREFPLISAFDGLNISYGIALDVILYGILLCCIVGIMLYCSNKWLISLVVGIFSLLILEDITRFQPWLYMFGLMLLSVGILKPKGEGVVLFAIRIILAGTYFWSGIQKINHAFAADIFPWLVSPLGLKSFFAAHHRLSYILPFLEVLCGIGLLTRQWQKISGILLIAMHLILLYVLGPFGAGWNKLIWPWNAALAVTLFFIIQDKQYDGLLPVKPMFRSMWFTCLVVFIWIMPAFNYIGYWDYDLSGSLYSGNNPQPVFYYIASDSSNMPSSAYYARVRYKGTAGEFLMIDQWAIDELDVPVYPQERYYIKIAQQLCNKVKQPSLAGLMIYKKEKFTSKQYTLLIKGDSLVMLK